MARKAKADSQLDRRLYAEARARGLPKTEAAKAAGSRATSGQALSNAGAMLEAEPEVQALIEEARADVIAGMQGDFELAKARAREVLQSDEHVKLWRHAWGFFERLHGPALRVEHSGPGGGPVSLAAFVERLEEEGEDA